MNRLTRLLRRYWHWIHQGEDYHPCVIEELPADERADPLGIHSPMEPERLDYSYHVHRLTERGEFRVFTTYDVQSAIQERKRHTEGEIRNEGWRQMRSDWKRGDPFGVVLERDNRVHAFTVIGGTDGADVRQLAQRKPSWPYDGKPADQEIPF